MFCGDGALAFAKQHGIDEVPFEYLASEMSRQRLANYPVFKPSVKVEFYEHADRSVRTELPSTWLCAVNPLKGRGVNWLHYAILV